MRAAVLRSRIQLLALLGVASVLALLPLFVTGALRTIAVRVLLAAGLGVAWNVMGGYGGHFSFGHAAYFGIGAYSGAVLVAEHGISPWLGMSLGAVLAGAFGAVTGWLAFRYRLKGAYFALATFAFAEMLRLVAMNQEFLNAARGLRVPVLPEPSWWMLQFPSGSANYYFVILGMFVALQAATILLMAPLLLA